jgi:hypothetical protein
VRGYEFREPEGYPKHTFHGVMITH